MVEQLWARRPRQHDKTQITYIHGGKLCWRQLDMETCQFSDEEHAGIIVDSKTPHPAVDTWDDNNNYLLHRTVNTHQLCIAKRLRPGVQWQIHRVPETNVDSFDMINAQALKLIVFNNKYCIGDDPAKNFTNSRAQDVQLHLTTDWAGQLCYRTPHLMHQTFYNPDWTQPQTVLPLEISSYSMDSDHDGNLHVVALHKNQTLYYARWHNKSWTYQRILDVKKDIVRPPHFWPPSIACNDHGDILVFFSKMGINDVGWIMYKSHDKNWEGPYIIDALCKWTRAVGYGDYFALLYVDGLNGFAAKKVRAT